MPIKRMRPGMPRRPRLSPFSIFAQFPVFPPPRLLFPRTHVSRTRRMTTSSLSPVTAPSLLSSAPRTFVALVIFFFEAVRRSTISWVILSYNNRYSNCFRAKIQIGTFRFSRRVPPSVLVLLRFAIPLIGRTTRIFPRSPVGRRTVPEFLRITRPWRHAFFTLNILFILDAFLSEIVRLIEYGPTLSFKQTKKA